MSEVWADVPQNEHGEVPEDEEEDESASDDRTSEVSSSQGRGTGSGGRRWDLTALQFLSLLLSRRSA